MKNMLRKWKWQALTKRPIYRNAVMLIEVFVSCCCGHVVSLYFSSLRPFVCLHFCYLFTFHHTMEQSCLVSKQSMQNELTFNVLVIQWMFLLFYCWNAHYLGQRESFARDIFVYWTGWHRKSRPVSMFATKCCNISTGDKR